MYTNEKMEKASNYAQSFIFTNTIKWTSIQSYYNSVPLPKQWRHLENIVEKKLLLGYVLLFKYANMVRL